MQSGDGLLLRIRARGPALSSKAIAAIADLAERHGNGRIETTRRANLQLRGVRPQALKAIHAALRDLGLLDEDQRAEAVRNILLSPLAGLDPSARIDGPAIAAAIEAGLAADETLHDLPAKFSFLVDEGGSLPLDDISADIRVTAHERGALVSIAGDAGGAIPVTLVEEASAAALALRIARAFLALTAGTGIRNLREALARFGTAAIASAAGLSPAFAAHRVPSPASANPAELYGRQAGFFGLGAAFGGIDAASLARLADLAVDGIRLTPWRALLVPGLSTAQERELRSLGFVTHAGDARLRVAACVGAPACASGQMPTRDIAAALASSLPASGRSGIALHVSGCAKGCARGASTPLTLVGRNGRFDLVVNGRADDRPVLTGLRESDLAQALGLSSTERAMAS